MKTSFRKATNLLSCSFFVLIFVFSGCGNDPAEDNEISAPPKATATRTSNPVEEYIHLINSTFGIRLNEIYG